MSGYELVEELERRGVDVKSHTTVYRYEHGKRMPPADYVAALADLAEVSVDDIMGGRQNGERAEADRQLVEHLMDVLAERGLPQDTVPDVAQSTVSRWAGLLRDPDRPPIRITPEHRRAVQAFIAAHTGQVGREVDRRARLMAATLLRDLASKLEHGATRPPDDDDATAAARDLAMVEFDRRAMEEERRRDAESA